MMHIVVEGVHAVVEAPGREPHVRDAPMKPPPMEAPAVPAATPGPRLARAGAEQEQGTPRDNPARPLTVPILAHTPPPGPRQGEDAAPASGAPRLLLGSDVPREADETLVMHHPITPPSI